MDEHSKSKEALGPPVQRPVGRPVPERAAFEAWLNPGGHAGNVSAWVEPGRYQNDTHQLAWLAWQHWENALRQTWQMVDPLKPAGQPGSYARGQDGGIVAALTTLRANLKTPNNEFRGQQREGNER